MKKAKNGFEIKIEKGISIPTGKNKYPFAEMQVGESFAVPLSMKNNVRTNLNQFKLRHKDFSFATRANDKEVRVWRVEPTKE